MLDRLFVYFMSGLIVLVALSPVQFLISVREVNRLAIDIGHLQGSGNNKIMIFCIRAISYSRQNLCDRRCFLPRRRQLSTSARRLPKLKSSSHGRDTGGREGDDTPPPYIIFGFGLPMFGITAASFYAYYAHLDNAPYTNRRRLLATSLQWEAAMGHEQYKALLNQYDQDILPKDHRASVTVQRVGSRIAAAAEKCSQEWRATKHRSNLHKIPNPPYTYTVVRSPDANAFVLPGNHVFVLTGLFKYAHDEDELASVLGHEMAHNISRHAGERVSESFLLAIVRRLALIIDPSGILFTFLIPAEQLFFTLPHNREHEMEADRIGIILASEACYDPHAAKRVFSRMKEDMDLGSRGQVSPPEWLSTHPGYDTRLSLFDQWMPEALERYNRDSGNKCRPIREEMKRARRLASEAHNG